MISIILLFIAGILNACMDVVSFRWDKSVFNKLNSQWFNPAQSWMNKWKWDGNKKMGEKFFGSSTFLVFLTDFWHFCKFLMLIAITAAAVFYTPITKTWWDLLIFYCTYTITFELFFSKILIRNKNI